MAKYVSKTAFTIGLLVLLMAVPALGASVNKSIDIAAGEEITFERSGIKASRKGSEYSFSKV